MTNKVYFGVIVLALTLTSCVRTNRSAVNDITSIPSATLVTWTPASLVETGTSTPSPSETPPSYPTLIPSKAEELIDKIVMSDEICSLPCWARIIPGKTHWSDTHSFLESFAKVSNHSPSQPRGYTIFISAPNDPPYYETWFATVYLDDDNFVKYIEGNKKRISIDQLLSKYGKPDEINLFILGVLPSDHVEKFRFVITYKERGFLLVYDGETINQHLLDICPLSITNDPSFWLWNPEDTDAFVTITEDKAYSSFWDYWPLYQEISIATKGEINVDSFYETFSNPANAKVCFRVPSMNAP